MTKKRFALDYSKCSLDELHLFVKNRKLIKDKSVQGDRHDCTLALERADRNAVFRFEDLPGEMRNRVYYELLILPELDIRLYPLIYCKTQRRLPGCHPQILATNSTVHEEASSILYGANSIDLHILRRMFQMNPNYVSHHVGMQRLPPESDSENRGFGQLRTCYDGWARPLLKFHKLRVHMSFEAVSYRGYYSKQQTKLEHLLFSLVSFLQQSSTPMTITIIGDTSKGSEMVPAELLLSLLYRFGRLVHSFDCRFQGFDEYPDVAGQLRDIAKEHGDFYKVNVLRKAELVREESEAYKALAEVSCDKLNLRQHTKMRGEMLRAFDLPFTKVEDERELLKWANDASKLYDEIYKREIVKVLNQASGFWLKLARRFKVAHKERLRKFPD